MKKKYQKYLDEKMGNRDIIEGEYEFVIDSIMDAIIKNEEGLKKYISSEILKTNDKIKIVKELFKASEKDPKIIDKILSLENLWDYDTSDIEKIKIDLLRVI